MDDKSIIECIESRDDKLFKNVKDLIDGYTTSITTLVTTENQNIKHSIDALTERVKRQNGSVRELNEWKAEITGSEKGKESIRFRRNTNTVKWAGIAGVIVAMFMAYLGYRNLTKGQASIKDDTKITNEILVPAAERSGYVFEDSIK